MNEDKVDEKTNPTPAKVKDKLTDTNNKVKLLLIIITIGSLSMFFWAEQQRRDTNMRLEQTNNELAEIRDNSQDATEDITDEILNKVRVLIDLPSETKPTVATLTDIDTLRSTSPFYARAKNGDYMIITSTRAVLYNAERNIIIDVLPIQIQHQEETSP